MLAISLADSEIGVVLGLDILILNVGFDRLFGQVSTRRNEVAASPQMSSPERLAHPP